MILNILMMEQSYSDELMFKNKRKPIDLNDIFNENDKILFTI